MGTRAYVEETDKNQENEISIFSKIDDGGTWWPDGYKKILTCGQLRNTQRYQKYVWNFFRVSCMLKPTVKSSNILISENYTV